MLMNIQCTSERADKKVWENNGLSGSNSDVVIANENSLDLAFIYPLKCLKKKKNEEKQCDAGLLPGPVSAGPNARRMNNPSTCPHEGCKKVNKEESSL